MNIQKSQWKHDILTYFLSHFPGFCHFIHLWRIPNVLSLALEGSFEFGGRYKSLEIDSESLMIYKACTIRRWAQVVGVHPLDPLNTPADQNTGKKFTQKKYSMQNCIKSQFKLSSFDHRRTSLKLLKKISPRNA